MDRNAVQPNIAAAGRVEASQQAQQRALAAAACPQNGHKLPRRNGHGDSLENLHPPRAVLNPLLRVPNLDHPARLPITLLSILYTLLFATLFLWTFADGLSFRFGVFLR